jgi:hypothetical protein
MSGTLTSLAPLLCPLGMAAMMSIPLLRRVRSRRRVAAPLTSHGRTEGRA